MTCCTLTTQSEYKVVRSVTADALAIVGSIAEIKSHLSNDLTTLYSDCVVSVQQVIGNHSGMQINVGDAISMLRSGGVVRLPSGRILIRGAAGEAIPQIRKT